MALPRYAVLQSPRFRPGYIIYYTDQEGTGERRGLIHCGGREVVSPLAKIEIENSKTTRGYVHIRSCYNNKYWCRSTQGNNIIAARANEQEEDRTQWNCTLFRPMLVTNNNNDSVENLRLIHAQTGRYVRIRAGGTPSDCLVAERDQVDQSEQDIYKVIDWESLLILPRYVAFKGHNGKYLMATRYFKNYPYFRFWSDDDSASSVMNEIFSNSDGSILIKSHGFGKFWRNSVSWINGDADENTAKSSNSCWFWPLKISDNVVVLRSLSNSRFCTSLTLDRKTDTLNAYESTAGSRTRMEVTELVLSRRIYHVDFRLDDARIYNERIQNMSSAVVTNNSSQPNTIGLKFSYTETTTKEWKASVSLKLGVKASFRAGIPIILGGKIQVTAEVNAGYEWGKTETKSTTVEAEYTVHVKPKTRLTAYLIATVGSCDVPFSYTQSDTLIDGTSRVQRMHDGMFTGVNSYNFRCETGNESPLSRDAPDALGVVVDDAVDLVKNPFGVLKDVQYTTDHPENDEHQDFGAVVDDPLDFDKSPYGVLKDIQSTPEPENDQQQD